MYQNCYNLLFFIVQERKNVSWENKMWLQLETKCLLKCEDYFKQKINKKDKITYIEHLINFPLVRNNALTYILTKKTQFLCEKKVLFKQFLVTLVLTVWTPVKKIQYILTAWPYNKWIKNTLN